MKYPLIGHSFVPQNKFERSEKHLYIDYEALYEFSILLRIRG